MNSTVLERAHGTNEIETPPMWAHQVEAFNFCKDLDASMLAMDMGTGKSRVAIELVEHKKAKLTLVVCPVAVLGVWRGEFNKHAFGKYRTLILNKGTVEKKAQAMKDFVKSSTGRPSVVVVNYDSYWRTSLGKEILKTSFDLVIYDEIHRLKTAGSKVSRFAARLHDQIELKIGMSGTPFAQNLIDIYAIYRALNNNIFGTRKQRFEYRYCLKGGYQGYQIVGYQNEEELQEKFYSIAFRVTKEECFDLPEQIFVDRTFVLTGEIKRIYNDVLHDFYSWVSEELEVTAANAAVKVLRLQQITSGIVKGDDGQELLIGDGKINLLRELAEDYPEEKPIIVFCRFRKDLEAVRDLAKTLKRKYGEVSGSRRDLTEDSKMPEWVQIMGVQIQSGSAGIDLTRSSLAVYYSTGHSLLDYEQSLSRPHRPGQRDPVTYYRLIAENTIDEKVFKALADKKNVINAILEKGEN